MSFDGSGVGDYITVNDSNSLHLTSFTLETWIYGNETGRFQRIINGGGAWYDFRIHSGNQYQLEIWNGTTWSSCAAGTFTANTWHHVVATHDGSANSSQWYIDGVTTGSACSITASPKNAAIYIGGNQNNEGFNGIADQVQIYNYVRSAAQIAWDYNKGKPVGHWKFDECQGGTANDSSGNSNSGTITIGASGEDTLGTCTTSSTAWGSGTTGKRNYSLSLDGTDDYVLVADNDNLSFTNKTMTINAWIKGNVVTGDNGIVVKRATSNFEYGFYVSDSKLSLNLWTAASASVCSTVGSATLSTNTWYFVTAVADGTNCYLYLNGVRDGTAGAISGTVSNGTAGVYIGYDNSGVARYLNGQIDDVKIFNYALTAAQVKNMMNDGAVRFGPSSSAP